MKSPVSPPAPLQREFPFAHTDTSDEGRFDETRESEHQPSAGPSRVAKREPPPPRALERASAAQEQGPARETVAVVRATPDPHQDPSQERPSRAGEIGREDEPLKLAMLDSVHYRAPKDAEFRQKLDPALRGGEARFVLDTWVPPHVARSATATPTLFWTISGPMDQLRRSGLKLGFAITAETTPEPLVETFLPLPLESGLQGTSLAQLKVSLAEDTIYRWSVFLRAASLDAASDQVAQGWIQYRPLLPSFARQVAAASPEERGSLYANAGYWYDAVENLVKLQSQHPDHPQIQESLNRLLSESGVR